jgi:RNA polymerase sigma-70 factor (ECF subfamily)
VDCLDDLVVALYDELHDSVWRYLLCLGAPRETAEDTIQETFLRLCTHLRRGGATDNLRAWVFRVAHNHALNERRNNRYLVLAGPVDDEAGADIAKDAGASPETLLLEREQIAHVQRALRTLSPGELRCIHLRMEGLRYREIGEVLGVTISTVSEHLRRAVTKLRRPFDV